MRPYDSHSGVNVIVPLRIHSPIAMAANRQPVCVGVPFPKGAVGEGWWASLNNGDKNVVPLQVAPQSHWSDGSVRWLLIEFRAPRLGIRGPQALRRLTTDRSRTS